MTCNNARYLCKANKHQQIKHDHFYSFIIDMHVHSKPRQSLFPKAGKLVFYPSWPCYDLELICWHTKRQTDQCLCIQKQNSIDNFKGKYLSTKNHIERKSTFVCVDLNHLAGVFTLRSFGPWKHALKNNSYHFAKSEYEQYILSAKNKMRNSFIYFFSIE